MPCDGFTRSRQIRTRLDGVPHIEFTLKPAIVNTRLIARYSISMKKRQITADQLMSELNADPVYLAARAREEEARQKRVAEWRRAEVPLIEELRSVGVAVESAWDLVSTAESYPKALPILLMHLRRSYPAAVREGIGRALAVREAKFAWEALTRMYQDESEVRAKRGMAVALSAIADDKTIGDLISLIKDGRNGSTRLLLLSALARSSDPRARKTLVELKGDQGLKKEIAVILRSIEKREQKKKFKERGFERSFPPETTTLLEASMNFDADMVGPFLERVSALIGGFGPEEISKLQTVVDELEVEDERELRFQVTHNGQLVPMNIRIFKDDEDAPDLYFFAPRKLIEEIDKVMHAFCEEHDI